MIDLNLLQKGEDYNRLKKSYVIFICTEDIFQKKRAIYTFENLGLSLEAACQALGISIQEYENSKKLLK